jgi:hypothetical protein
MCSNHKNNDSTNTDVSRKSQPLPLLVWQESAEVKENNHSKIVELETYRRSQVPVSESTIIGWELTSHVSAKPVRLIMVSSGFAIRSVGNHTIQNIAA